MLSAHRSRNRTQRKIKLREHPQLVAASAKVFLKITGGQSCNKRRQTVEVRFDRWKCVSSVDLVEVGRGRNYLESSACDRTGPRVLDWRREGRQPW